MYTRIAAALLAAGLATAVAAPPSRAQDLGDIFSGLGRALTPDQERERTERRGRYEEYDRDRDRRADVPYRDRYDPSDDRFWSEAAQRLDYERMGSSERRRYDDLSASERRRFEEDAGYERKRWYERASDAERRRYDQALEEMEDERRREGRRSGR